jgi:SlyX protein
MNERVVDLEVRYSYVERQLEALSGVLFEQQRLVEKLERRVKELEARVQGIGDATPNEPPPHY